MGFIIWSMKEPTTPPWFSTALTYSLYAFAFTAVASIALQNLIWVAVALLLFIQFKKHRNLDWPRGPFALATLLFAASFFVGAIIGINPSNSFNTVHKYLTILLFFFVGAMPILLAQAKRLLTLLNYGTAICAIHGIGKHYLDHQERIDSFSGDKMVFGGMLMVCLLFQIYLLKVDPKSWIHWLTFFLIGFGLLLTETRGAWLGFGFGALLLGWKFNRKWLGAGILAVCLSFFLLPAELQNRVKSIWTIHLAFKDGLVQSSDYHERPLIWQAGWNIVKDHPFGIGQGNLGELYPKYKHPLASEPNVPHLHDNYLQILAQNGWEGFAVYLFWIGTYFFTASLWKPPDNNAGELNWTFLCVFSAVLVWGLTEYTFSHQFMNLQFFLLGLQAALWRTGKTS